MDGKNKQKVYIETSFVSYLTRRATTRETIALDDRLGLELLFAYMNGKESWNDRYCFAIVS